LQSIRKKICSPGWSVAAVPGFEALSLALSLGWLGKGPLWVTSVIRPGNEEKPEVPFNAIRHVWLAPDIFVWNAVNWDKKGNK
jgi:hypothetical protein